MAVVEGSTWTRNCVIVFQVVGVDVYNRLFLSSSIISDKLCIKENLLQFHNLYEILPRE